METIQPPPTTSPVSSVTPGTFGTKIPSTVTFAVGILLFLLPFSEIKCNQTVLLNKTGLGFALGSNWKPINTTTEGDKTSSDVTTKANTEKEGNVQYFAIAALALGVLGLLLSFANARSGGTGGVVTGILSAGALIGMMIDLKSWFNNSLAKEAANKTQEGTDTLGLNKLGNSLNNAFTIDFTPWFYVAVVAFLAAAFFSYRRMVANRK
ncbi:MAG TPA: hypothetical protein VET23_09925 [Chitinophagaceae bacterium]|nr:hypothetical protein [Chitinophagaceae bacterium]